MESFDHVHSDFIRSVLTGENVDIKAIHGAAYATEYCMAEDWKSAFIPLEVMQARETFIDQMGDRLCNADYAGAVQAMRGFWSI
jgi:hypothetical protein